MNNTTIIIRIHFAVTLFQHMSHEKKEWDKAISFPRVLGGSTCQIKKILLKAWTKNKSLRDEHTVQH
jgi:hypothetical protein